MEVHECVSFILVKGDEVLLETWSKDRDFDPGMIAIPGGHMEKGEIQPMTLIRELDEELNIKPQRWGICVLYITQPQNFNCFIIMLSLIGWAIFSA